jgi:hypothetical protein
MGIFAIVQYLCIIDIERTIPVVVFEFHVIHVGYVYP